MSLYVAIFFFFFFNDTATTEIYTLSLHDALPIFFGGKVKSFDATNAKAVPGVKHVVQISTGVAVVADGYWSAEKGRDALTVTWDEGPTASVSSASISELFGQKAGQTGAVARHDGDAQGALPGAATN